LIDCLFIGLVDWETLIPYFFSTRYSPRRARSTAGGGPHHPQPLPLPIWERKGYNGSQEVVDGKEALRARAGGNSLRQTLEAVR